MKLGVEPSTLGFRYLIKAIEICYEDSDVLYSGGITKHLYPNIAKEFGTTYSRVERAIRYSVERMHDTNPKASEILIFPPSVLTGKYTNSQFIGACVEYFKMNEE